jgi:hypothetical protein
LYTKIKFRKDQNISEQEDGESIENYFGFKELFCKYDDVILFQMLYMIPVFSKD